MLPQKQVSPQMPLNTDVRLTDTINNIPQHIYLKAELI
ncbi:hypothetical protein PTRA_a2118 [Pseudoalteromonas translucida KMM 520]|uniref:Uncharacterized protein n=1 Tax=Pseudoalteromonas translucida KMM 520 TaxID=1315283 RepID=A0A0U2LNG0_9GAMM|nr:hypothetical protein PTRA_a2118 [Pseudoalteromonas translucida KMM 520]